MFREDTYGCPPSVQQMRFVNEQTDEFGTRYLEPSDKKPCIYRFFCGRKECPLVLSRFEEGVYPYEMRHLKERISSDEYQEILDNARTIQNYYGFCKCLDLNEYDDHEKLTTEIIEYVWDDNRTLYTREYERIIFTNLFRRLQYKTQVMVNSASDDQRTRLLHSLEVQKIAKKIAIGIHANWELVETIAIAHDIGHAPFGHAGESAIDHYLRDNGWGAFSHALQGVKVLQQLTTHPVLTECGIKGLGLSQYVLEGVLKHDADSFTDGMLEPAYKLQYDAGDICKPVGIDGISFDLKIKDFLKAQKLPPRASLPQVWIGSIESQIVAWADKVAYLGHDWEEFVETGLLEELMTRLNDMLIEIERISSVYKSKVGRGGNAGETEESLINNIWESIIRINKIYNAQSGEKIQSLDKVWELALDHIYSIIESVMKIERLSPEIIQNDVEGNATYTCYKYFAASEYRALRNYFLLTVSWVKLLDLYPRTYGLKFDPIYTFYQFLLNIRPNVVAPRVVNALIRGTNRYMKEKCPDNWKREDYLIQCNEKWAYKYIKVRGEYSNIKEQRKILKKSLRTCFIVGFHTKKGEEYPEDEYDYLVGISKNNPNAMHGIIGKYDFNYEYDCLLNIFEFINDEFIGSTRVKFMKHTAQDIISRLMDYYVKHPDMLPFNQRKEYNKMQFELIKNRRVPEVLSENYTKEFNSVRARAVADYVASMTDRMSKLKYDEIVSSESRWSDSFDGNQM